MLAVLVATTAAPPGPAPSAAELVRPVLEETLQEWLTHYYYNNGESAEPRGSIAAAVYVEATGETVATAGGKIDCANTTTMNMSKPAGGDDTLPACQQDAGAHDPYPLGSITKMYTGARVMQLIEQGRLRLDSRVAPIVDPYLAWLNATGHNVWLPSLAARFGAQVQNLTVHDLLHMRVEGSSYDSLYFLKLLDADHEVDITPVRLLGDPGFGSQISSKQSSFNYNSNNFILLGLLVAALDVDAHGHWRPGVAAGYYDQTSAIPPSLRAALSRTHFATGRGTCADFSPVHGYDGGANAPGNWDPKNEPRDYWAYTCTCGYTAGNAVASAGDVARFVGTLLGGPPTHRPTDRIVSEATAAQMMAATADWATLPTSGFKGYLYGLGLFNLSKQVGHKVGPGGDGRTLARGFGHGGETYGYMSNVVHLPDLGVTAAFASATVRLSEGAFMCHLYPRLAAALGKAPAGEYRCRRNPVADREPDQPVCVCDHAPPAPPAPPRPPGQEGRPWYREASTGYAALVGLVTGLLIAGPVARGVGRLVARRRAVSIPSMQDALVPRLGRVVLEPSSDGLS